jgi:purine-binding chemotaxis protein CheW
MNAHAQSIGSTDWKEVRRRLEEAVTATEETARLTPQRARTILEERARVLARVAPAPPAPGEVLQVVTFTLGEERYAIETSRVREVVRLGEAYARLPGAPAFVFGAMNLRGEILTVFDLRPVFGVPQRESSDRSRIVVLGTGHAEFGILVDDAHEVLAVRRDHILEPPAALTGQGREYVVGVTSGAVIVLDGGVLLRDGRLFVDQDSE